MKPKRDIELLFELGCLRFVNRSWSQFLNPNVANVSEHIFRVSWLAMMIGYAEKANVEKILKMSLIHDLGESRTGDTNPVTREYNDQDEAKAISDIFKNTFLDGEAENLYKEYKSRKTKEAKIVKDADNLEVDLEVVEQEKMGYQKPKIWNKVRDIAGKNLYTKTARDIYKKIRTADCHDWHVNSPNRFKDIEKWMK